MNPRRAAALLLLSIYVVFLLDLTWLQFSSDSPVTNLVPLRTIISDWKHGGRELIINFLGNIVAFLPIGLIPAMARPRGARARHAVLFSMSLSALIEAVQYVGGHRYADVDDIILNTAGGVLGYSLLRISSELRPRPVVGDERG